MRERASYYRYTDEIKGTQTPGRGRPGDCSWYYDA